MIWNPKQIWHCMTLQGKHDTTHNMTDVTEHDKRNGTHYMANMTINITWQTWHYKFEITHNMPNSKLHLTWQTWLNVPNLSLQPRPWRPVWPNLWSWPRALTLSWPAWPRTLRSTPSSGSLAETRSSRPEQAGSLRTSDSECCMMKVCLPRL